MRDLSIDGIAGDQKAYRVAMDGTWHVVIAPSFETALRAARAWWRSNPDSADDSDAEIDRYIDRVELLTDSANVILSDEAETALQIAALQDGARAETAAEAAAD